MILETISKFSELFSTLRNDHGVVMIELIVKMILQILHMAVIHYDHLDKPQPSPPNLFVIS